MKTTLFLIVCLLPAIVSFGQQTKSKPRICRRRAPFFNSIKMLWIVAILSFAGAVLYSVYPDYSQISINMLLFSLLLIAISGSLLAFFIKRNNSYKKRLPISIPVAMLVFVVFTGVYDYVWGQGFTTPYNKYSARKDLKNGIVQIVTAGQFIHNEYMLEEDKIRKDSFGYVIFNSGVLFPGTTMYNKEVGKYLEKRNGKDWKQRQAVLFESLRKKP